MTGKDEGQQPAAVTGDVTAKPAEAPTRRRLLQGLGAGSFAALGMTAASAADANCPADQESDGHSRFPAVLRTATGGRRYTAAGRCALRFI